MKKIKESKSYEDVRKYHYTVGNFLSQIIHDGEIKLATAFCRKKREHAVWLSTNEFWEETANKAFKLPDGSISNGNRELTHFKGGGLARIEVKPKTAPFNWISYVRKSKIPGKLKRGLVAAAKKVGSNPSDWYVSYQPIKRDDWLSIELFNWETQSWVPCQ
jgi:hypothetical protein